MTDNDVLARQGCSDQLSETIVTCKATAGDCSGQNSQFIVSTGHISSLWYRRTPATWTGAPVYFRFRKPCDLAHSGPSEGHHTSRASAATSMRYNTPASKRLLATTKIIYIRRHGGSTEVPRRFHQPAQRWRCSTTSTAQAARPAAALWRLQR